MMKIQEILNKGWEDYKNNNKVVGYKQKVVIAIANCKTGKKLQWIEARKEEVLNIKYYHLVFTIPDELNVIVLQNQNKIYNILFKASSETLQELAEDKKYLGGEIGFFSILHTWGQNMMYHPHVHIVATGGGLTSYGKWIEKENDFFIPVKVMSRVFRGKFMSYLKNEKLEFYGENKYLENPANYNDLIQNLYKKEWIVYCKEPFKNANCVIQYLGRYTHRVAISNERILAVTEDDVTFKWRDYKDKNKKFPALELLKQTLGKAFNLCPLCKKGHMLIPNTT